MYSLAILYDVLECVTERQRYAMSRCSSFHATILVCGAPTFRATAVWAKLLNAPGAVRVEKCMHWQEGYTVLLYCKHSAEELLHDSLS